MPKYRLEKDHYLQDNARGIDPQLHTQGTTVDWEGPPSLGMTPLDDSAKDRKREYDASRPKAKRSSVGWSPGLEKTFLKSLSATHDEGEAPTADTKSRRKRAA